MKKVLSLVLAFAMILGSFGFVFGTQFSDVSDTEVFSEAVNVLSGLGVIGGYPDGTFKPANVVTRAEMATMIVNCLGIPVSGGSATKFSDVPESHWASGFIAYAASVGFIAGYPDGTFKPEQQVTCNEALTMIIASLGYTLESLNGEYPGAFVNKAKGLGILDTCKKTGTVGAERSDIACYLYDALDAELGVVNKDGEFVSNYQQSGYTKEDNYLVRLGATLYNGGNPFIVDEAELDNSVVNLVDYLGAFITAYQNKDGEIVAIKEVMSEFIEGDLADLQDAYKAVEVASQDAEGDGYISFTNGEEDSPAQDIDAPTSSIKLAVKLSGKTVKTIYSMQVWDPEPTFRADGVQDEIIDDQKIGGYDLPLDEDDEIDTNAFSIVGRNTITDIEDDDIVTVYLKGGKIVKIEVGTEVVTGTVSKITTGGKYTVGDKTFKAHDDADPATVAAVDVDSEGTFYLAYNGKWFDFDEADDSTSNYAILLATGKEEGKYGDTTYYVNMFLADGTEKEFVVKGSSIPGGYTAPDDAIGELVKYTVNSSDKVVGLEAATAASDLTFDKNGICGGVALKDSTVAFEFTGSAGDEGDASCYKVLEVSALYDGTVLAMTEIKASGAFKAVLVEGVTGATESLAIFVSDDAKVADGELWTALFEGKVTEMTLDGATPTEADMTASPASITFYKLTMNADGIVTDATAKAPAEEKSVDVSDAVSVSGNVFTDAAKTNYSLDADIVVYVYDESDDEWTAKTASALAGRKNAFKSITLYKTGTGDYDIAIVVKP